ncbi:MAG: CvpA family protein [Pseudomonadales bacterium]|jgi:membrane protein required for colicin V production|nr:CvpA family protein [Pseudomonadales bacterium]
MSMTVADIVIIVAVAISCFAGALRGLVREALSLCVWVLAGFFAAAFAERAAPWFASVIASPSLQLVAGFALMFVLGVFVGGIVTNMLSKLTSAIGLGGADKALGMLFGLLRGLLVVMVAVVLTMRVDTFRNEWYANSLLVPQLMDLADYFGELFGLDPTLIHPPAATMAV